MTHDLSERANEITSDRFVAYLIDFALLSAVTFVLWIVLFGITAVLAIGSIAAAPGSSTSPMAGEMFATATLVGTVLNVVLWIVIGVLLVWYFAYYADDGQTIGKRSQDVSVVDENGDVPSKRQRLIRTAVLLAPFPLMALVGGVLGALGFVVALFFMVVWLVVEAVVLFVSDDARRLGDNAADTYVVDTDA